MALYSAKEAKWYRRNVERREHCQIFINSFINSLRSASSESFFRFFVFDIFSSVTITSVETETIAKIPILFSPFSFLFFFSLLLPLFTAPLCETSLDRLLSPYRKSDLITSRAARARRREGIKRTRAKAVLTGLSQVRRTRSRGTIEHLVKVAGSGTGFKC